MGEGPAEEGPAAAPLAPGLRDALSSATDEFAASLAALQERSASIASRQRLLAAREAQLRQRLEASAPRGEASAPRGVALDEEAHLDHRTPRILVRGAADDSANGVYERSAQLHHGCAQWWRAAPLPPPLSPLPPPLSPAEAWRLYWREAWVLGRGDEPPRYACAVDFALGVSLGRWKSREAMAEACRACGGATELFTTRWTAANGGAGGDGAPTLARAPPSFIESPFPSRAQYEQWLEAQCR
ncbi:hypothetical protein AB1Y20_013791 [Prymnesium parvum]|uniref:Uncharacterized protein n=1 Tax=Prymnesium parvum TaxID=97485 RepID=A0AB34IGJ3_PRYPA